MDQIYVGGDLQEYIGVEETKKLIDYTDQIYLYFGADKHLEGTEYKRFGEYQFDYIEPTSGTMVEDKIDDMKQNIKKGKKEQ